MKIETKFNIGDTVWAMNDNKALSFTVSRIDVSVVGNKVGISYMVSLYGLYLGREEQDIFATKKELIESL